MSQPQLDRLDIHILRMLAGNGRKPYLEIARECNVSGAAIHQRIAKLNNSGVLESVETIMNPEILGYDICVFIALTMNIPIDEAVSELEKIPEITECHVIMGEDQLLIKLYARSKAHLAQILNERIRPLGMVRLRPATSMRQAFHRPLPVVMPGEEE